MIIDQMYQEPTNIRCVQVTLAAKEIEVMLYALENVIKIPGGCKCISAYGHGQMINDFRDLWRLVLEKKIGD